MGGYTEDSYLATSECFTISFDLAWLETSPRLAAPTGE
jgi:hypothetical protein